jgi:hypothetical protein
MERLKTHDMSYNMAERNNDHFDSSQSIEGMHKGAWSKPQLLGIFNFCSIIKAKIGLAVSRL